MIKKILDNKGVSLAETVVATGIFGVVAYIFVGSSDFLSGLNSDVKNKLSIERAVISIFDSVQSNAGKYQITSDPSNFLDVTNKGDLMKSLPLAWNDKILVDKSECPRCRGRLGYILTPHPGYRGLYRLHVRVVHTHLIESFKDYYFLINGQ